MNSSSKENTVLVTGANRGIGLELTRQLLQRGWHVIAVCRSHSQELADLEAEGIVEVFDGVDVSSEDDVTGLARRLEGRKLHWLVNNAGILERDSLETLDFASIERQFRVNTLGPLRVAAALRGLMGEGSKIFVITSAMGSISDNTSGGYYGYRISKAAVNMAFKSLSVDLRDHGIGVFKLHPGYVATDMTAGQGDVTPEQSAAGLIQRMEELELTDTGAFRHARGHDLEW
ncbi:MAG: SDR family oxidoreductase [Xanthomonadales bacterium]|nr:SDR family oxidoreductase [Xanthomonadales bacterium]